MSNERLGIVEEIAGRRQSFAERHPALARFFTGRGPRHIDAQITKITVNCATGERTVEKQEPPPREPAANKLISVDLRYRSMPSIAAIMGARDARHRIVVPPAKMAKVDALNRSSLGLRPSYASAVAQIVCEVYEVSYSRLVSPERARTVAWPRFAAFLILRKRTGASLTPIGKFFNRDHTSVMHGLAKAEWLMVENAEWRARYDEACALLDNAARSP